MLISFKAIPNLINFLAKYGIILKSATEALGEDSEGKLMQNIIASFAQYDNDVRSQRTQSGIVEAVKEGRWVWKASIGYEFIQRDGKSFLVPNGERYIIEKIFKDIVNGKKQYEVIEDLSLTGFRISKQRLNKILANPIYIGKIKSVFFEGFINGLHDPIIEDIYFYKVQDILNGKVKSDYSNDFINDFPLRRFLKCPICNKSLTGSWSQGRSKKYPYYHCTTKGCGFKPIKKENAELIFLNYLEELEPNENQLDNFINSVEDFIKDKQKENNKIINKSNYNIRELEFKKERIEDLAINGTFTKDRFIKKVSEVEEELARKKLQLEDIKKEKIDIESLLNYCKYFLSNISKLWLNSLIENKRKLQDLIFPEGIYIKNDKLRTAKINLILS